MNKYIKKLLFIEQNGFTIIELMIATSVLAVLLLVSSVVMIEIGNLFEKGINVTNLQNDSRNIISDISSSIEFSGTQMSSNSYPYSYSGSTNKVIVYSECFGNDRYSYVLGFPPSGWPHTIWKDVMQTQGSCDPLNIGLSTPSCSGYTPGGCVNSLAGTGSELAGTNMHIVSLNVIPYSNQLYAVNLDMVLGQQTLFETNKITGKLITDPYNNNYVCSNDIGQQYCASSALSSLAVERLN